MTDDSRNTYIQEHFNAGMPLVYSERRLTLSEALDELGISQVDVLKIDTDGHDAKVLLGAERFLSRCKPLLIIVEASFHGAPERYDAVLAAIDGILRPQGYSPLDMEVWRYSRSALPMPFAYDLFAQTTRGPIGYCDVYYYDDPLSQLHKLDGWLNAAQLQRCYKLLALYELYGLQDCAAELILALRSHPASKDVVDWNNMLDHLVPDNPFGITKYEDYIAFFEEHPTAFYPSNWQSGPFSSAALWSGAEPTGSEGASVPLDTLRAVNEATSVRVGDDLLLTTSPQPDSFAAYAAFELPNIISASQRVEVALQVLEGQVSIGWFKLAEQRWVARKLVAPGKHIVQLVIPIGTSEGQLIFQNTTANGPARVLVERIILSSCRVVVDRNGTRQAVRNVGSERG